MNIKNLAIIALSGILLLGGCGKGESVSPSATEKPEILTEATTSPTAAPSEKPEKTAAPAETKAPEATKAPAAKPEQTAAPKSAADTLSAVLSGIETPRYEIMPIDAESFESFFFVPYVQGAEAVTADALISSTAHSVCLVSLPPNVDAQNFAAQVKQKADPRKWICVEAESVQVKAKGNMVLLVMSDTKTANAIINNF